MRCCVEYCTVLTRSVVRFARNIRRIGVSYLLVRFYIFLRGSRRLGMVQTVPIRVHATYCVGMKPGAGVSGDQTVSETPDTDMDTQPHQKFLTATTIANASPTMADPTKQETEQTFKVLQAQKANKVSGSFCTRRTICRPRFSVLAY